MSTDDNDAYGDVDKSNLKFIYEQFLRKRGRKMFVANRMTKNPVTVTPQTTLNEVGQIMKKNRFRRMPVVENGKLVGFFSDRDLMRVAPSPATTLSKYEIRELLDKLTVKDIMVKDVLTVGDDATIEEAALIMYNNKIGGLPVISDVGAVVGVITETDIFKTLVSVMGLLRGTTRFTIEVDDKMGVIQGIGAVFAENGLNLDSFVTCKQPNGKYEIVVRGRIPENVDIKSKLEEKGFHVIHEVRIGED